ncbi:hypothetical protein V6N13_045631 [Hibiscus sabdariffa]|uniref:Uncharacterized protein n=1 Tax=Hibiscus sabdariffa TaxID=183260 RepID=A0ABR2RLK5_9ROSI
MRDIDGRSIYVRSKDAVLQFFSLNEVGCLSTRLVLSTPSVDSISREKALSKELSTLLGAEEKFLRQKSRVQFIKHGDRNSAYFFRQVATRQSSNTIQVLHDSQGHKLNTFEGISAELVRHFSKALETSDPCVVQFPDEFFKEILGKELTRL